MKKITDKDVERLKAWKKITKETDLKQRMTLWTGNLRLKTLNHNLI